MIPAGNTTEKALWQQARAQPPSKPEIKLTPGKGLEDLTVPLEKIIDMVVQENKASTVLYHNKISKKECECLFVSDRSILKNRNLDPIWHFFTLF